MQILSPYCYNPADLGQISLEVHKYELNSEVVLPPYNKTAGRFSLGTFPISALDCAVFIDIATKNKVIYKQNVRKEEAKIQKY